MSALKTALAKSERSYLACKASVSTVTTDLLSHGPSGVPIHRPDLARAPEQLRHFKGWTYASIRAIAQKVAGQKLHVGVKSTRRLGTKNHQPVDVEPLESHPLLDLFHDPNELMVSWSLVYSTVASLQLCGRSLWWLPNKEQILPIPISWLRGFEGTSSFQSFKISPPHSGQEYALPADECVYFSFPDPSDPHGAVSPLQAAGLAVDADEAIQTSQQVAFRRGIHPSHAIIVGKDSEGRRRRLSASQQRQIVSALQRRYAGAVNAGEPFIIDDQIEDIKTLSHSPAEMNWLESSQLTKNRILQGFGVNETIIGSKESNRASATAADKHFIDFTINPLIELMSQTLTEWLSPMFGGDIVIWIEKAVANDAEMQLKHLTLLAKHSAITGDELRELSPFDLELGQFSEPVSASGRNPAEDALTDAMEEAAKALSSPVDFKMPYDPINRIADDILNKASGDTPSVEDRLNAVARELDGMATHAEKHLLNGSHK